MKPRSKPHCESALTLIEVLVAIAIVVLLGLLMIPGNPPRSKATLTQCLSNLKGIGIAETMWAYDHNTNFPASVSTNQEGTMEYLAAGRVDFHFRALTNYGLSLRSIHCPDDSRVAAENFTAFGITNISYFASLDAAISNQSLFVSGDRNLTINGKTMSPGFATITSKTSAGWSGEMHNTSRIKRVGTLLFPDSHVEATNEEKLSALTASMGTATNRLVFP